MMTLHQVATALSDRNLMEVARRTGIHQETLRHIRSGKAKNPGFNTMTRLIEYLEGDK